MRRKIIFIIVLLLIFGVAGWYWFFYFSPITIQPVNAPTVNQNLNQGVLEPSVIAVPPAEVEPVDPSLGWRVLAMNFAERYGTYSTDLPFQNLKSLGSLITPSFQERINTQLVTGTITPGFYSVTTRTLIASPESTSSDTIVVDVSTQRSERFNRDSALQLSYQTLRVVLKQVDSNWLVDEVAWQKQ